MDNKGKKRVSNSHKHKNYSRKNRSRKSHNRNDHIDTGEYRKFASASAANTGSSGRSVSINGISEARLKSMMEDPSKNAGQIAGLSKSVKNINGIYKRIIKYMSSLLTFDHVIYPVFEDPSQMINEPEEMKLAFANGAIVCDRLNPKFNLPLITEKIFTNGTAFLYKIEDSKGIAYMEMPINLCRIGYLEDGVYRYFIDVSKIQDTAIEAYPKEIQNAYQSYKNGATERLVEGKWYEVSDKGVAFTLDPDALTQGGMSLPPLANALIDVLKLENAKDSMEDISKLDNSKIVHSKIETDDRGRPLMELPVVLEYHNALKKNLPEGAVAITNPFDTTALTLNGTGKDGKFGLLDKSKENLFDGAGVSQLLFAGDGASSQALERSIQVDSQWMFNFLLPMYANYYDYELKKAGRQKGHYWKIKFLHISHFARDEAIKTSKDQLSYGGSRLEYLAYTGMTPIEVANMLIFEQRVLSIDEFMIAKQNSHTMSSKDTDGAGAPKSKDPTDTTIRIKDSE